MEERTKNVARELLVMAKSLLGGEIKGWIDPHGKYFEVLGGMTHENFARKYWGLRGGIDESNPYAGSDKMYELGWFRVVPYGSDALSAMSMPSIPQSLHYLNDIQIRMLRDMAIKHGMTRVVLDNGGAWKTVWSDDSLDMVAHSKTAFEFPSEDALKKYLKDHPKAKPDNHWVKDQKSEKKTDDSTQKVQKKVEKTETRGKSVDFGKYEITENKALKYETPGDLGNVKKWKAKIILGNSMAKGKKIGDMDDVGYVGINTRTNEIVPIARADEHQAGHELLYHLAKKGMIKGNPADFVTLYPGTNYPHYSSNNTHQYVEAIKKWLAYGGPNGAVHSVATPQGGWSSGREKEYITDMEEYAAKDGDVDYGQKGPTKPAKELLDNMEGGDRGSKEGGSEGI